MNTETVAGNRQRPLGGFKIFLIVLATIVVTAAVTFWVVRTYIFPSEFKPVQLSAREEITLNSKLEKLDQFGTSPRSRQGGSEQTLEPEVYSEEGASRSIRLSEREVNALLARNTDLARKLAIDLSEDLVSAKLLVPVDEDFPFFGGQILKVRAGLELAYRDDRPIVIVKGISVMGVPVPNAWLGGIKNIDLVQYYGEEAGFWKAFRDGLKNIRVVDGQVNIELNE